MLPGIFSAQCENTISSACSNCTTNVLVASGLTVDISSLDPQDFENCPVILGTLVIDEPTTWSGLEVSMGAGARIRVEDALTIVNTLIKDCGDLWFGIEAVSGSGLHVSESIIRGAEYALFLTDNVTLTCRDNDFINNYIGIATGDPFGTVVTPVTVQQAGPVTGCRFYMDGNLPTPYSGSYYEEGWPLSTTSIDYSSGFAAFYLKGTNGFGIGVPGSAGTGCDRNEIRDLRNGVLSRYGSVNIYNTDFHDFTGSVNPALSYPDSLYRNINQQGIFLYRSQGRIVGDTIKEVMVGIQAIQSRQEIRDNILDIADDTDVGLTRGIELSNPMGSTVIGNTVTNGYRGIAVNGAVGSFRIAENVLYRDLEVPLNAGIDLMRIAFCDNGETGIVEDNVIQVSRGASAVGINLVAGCKVTISDNTISFGPDEGVGTNNAGISAMFAMRCRLNRNLCEASDAYLEEDGNVGIIVTDGNNNILFCNTMDDMQRGMWIVGENMDTRLLTNVFYDADTGLELAGPAEIGLQEHHQNQWLDPEDAYTYGAYISGPDPTVTANNSELLCDESDGDDGELIPTNLGPPSVETSWFIDDDGVGLECENPPSGDLVPDPDSLVNLVLNPPVFSTYDAEMDWIRKVNILDHLMRDSTYLAEPVLDGFFDAEMLAPRGLLAQAQYMLLRSHGTDKSTLDELQDTTNYFLNRISVLDSMIFGNPLNLTALIGQRQATVDSLEPHVIDWLDLASAIDSTSLALYDETRDEVNGITVTTALDNSLKKSLLILAKYLLKETWSSTDTAQIIALSSQCTWQGGRGMPLAQMLYSIQFDSARSHIPIACSSPLFSSTEHAQSNIGSLSIFPNPTAGRIHVGGTMEPEQLSIYTLDGKLIYAGTFDLISRQLDVSSFHPGVYILVAYQAGSVYTSKFVRL